MTGTHRSQTGAHPLGSAANQGQGATSRSRPGAGSGVAGATPTGFSAEMSSLQAGPIG